MTPEALSELFLLAPVGFMELDNQGMVLGANHAARRLLAPFSEESASGNLYQLLGHLAPDLPSAVRAFVGDRGVVVQQRELLAPSQAQGIILSLVKVGAERMVALVTDGAALADARGLSAQLAQRLEAISGVVRDHALYTLDAAGRIDSWSTAAERVHQFVAGEIVGQSMRRLVSVAGASDADAEAAGDAYVQETLRLAARNGWCEEEGHRLRQDGSLFWASTVVTALRDATGGTIGYSIVTHDVSERRKFEDRVRDESSAATDYLTGVASRRAFFDVTQAEVARARRYGQSLTLLLLDPDDYRARTEAFGETFRDEWLRVMAWICRQESRNTDVVGRVGGEAFAVLLPSTELSGGLVLAERIRERMQRHVFGAEHSGARVTISVGVAEVSDDVATMDALVAAAATAVSRAQQAGRNLVVGFNA